MKGMPFIKSGINFSSIVQLSGKRRRNVPNKLTINEDNKCQHWLDSPPLQNSLGQLESTHKYIQTLHCNHIGPTQHISGFFFPNNLLFLRQTNWGNFHSSSVNQTSIDFLFEKNCETFSIKKKFNKNLQHIQQFKICNCRHY